MMIIAQPKSEPRNLEMQSRCIDRTTPRSHISQIGVYLEVAQLLELTQKNRLRRRSKKRK